MSFLAASAQVAPADLLTNGSFESAWELDALFRRREPSQSEKRDGTPVGLVAEPATVALLGIGLGGGWPQGAAVR